MTLVRLIFKIKTVKSKSAPRVQESAAAKRRRMGVGDTATVRHCFAEGLWEFEGADGQTYLAVTARPWRPGHQATYTADVDLPQVPPPNVRQLRPETVAAIEERALTDWRRKFWSSRPSPA